MTSFMIQVADTLEGTPTESSPRVRHSVEQPAGTAADQQVQVRALAEQLVAEANAVLAHEGQGRIELSDELGPGLLGFEVRFGDRSALLLTTFYGHTARTRLIGVGADGADVELDGVDEIAGVILRLIGTSSSAFSTEICL